ncbi:uncharacterized protein TNCV_3446351 [Trichonephila clavipes]|nr:uncharacterized protein TNCV_3446351 [Trichonephila clavipes]
MSKLDIHEILPISYKSLINTKNVLCIGKSEVRVRDLEVQALMKTIVLIPGIDRKIGGENRNNERYANNSRPQREFNRFENQGFANRRFEGRRQSGQSDQPFHSQGGRQSGSRNSSFRGQNERSRNLNFLSDRCEYGGNRSRGTENPPVWDHRPIRVSSIRMTPVELPYVPILLNETFITALWDTGAEKSFISEEVYRNYFFIPTSSKDKDKIYVIYFKDI